MPSSFTFRLGNRNKFNLPSYLEAVKETRALKPPKELYVSYGPQDLGICMIIKYNGRPEWTLLLPADPMTQDIQCGFTVGIVSRGASWNYLRNVLCTVCAKVPYAFDFLYNDDAMEGASEAGWWDSAQGMWLTERSRQPTEVEVAAAAAHMHELRHQSSLSSAGDSVPLRRLESLSRGSTSTADHHTSSQHHVMGTGVGHCEPAHSASAAPSVASLGSCSSPGSLASKGHSGHASSSSILSTVSAASLLSHNSHHSLQASQPEKHASTTGLQHMPSTPSSPAPHTGPVKLEVGPINTSHNSPGVATTLPEKSTGTRAGSQRPGLGGAAPAPVAGKALSMRELRSELFARQPSARERPEVTDGAVKPGALENSTTRGTVAEKAPVSTRAGVQPGALPPPAQESSPEGKPFFAKLFAKIT